MTCKASAVTCKCKSNADCAGEDDGDLCNGTFYCDKSKKVPDCVFNKASLVFCPKAQDEACLKASCDPKTGKCGLQPVKAGTGCSGSDACLVAKKCNGKGDCVGTKKPCDDKNACTKDSCDAKTGCVHMPVVCSDGNGCTADTCDKAKGTCGFSAKAMEGKTCNSDDNACTVNDVCTNGVCKTGTPAVCKLKVGPCENPTCVSKGPSAFSCVPTTKKDGAACEDGDICTAGSRCKGGTCQPGLEAKLFTKTLSAHGCGSSIRAIAQAPNGNIAWVGMRIEKDMKKTTGWGSLTDGLSGVKGFLTHTAPMERDLYYVTAVTVDALDRVVVAGTVVHESMKYPSIIVDRRDPTTFKAVSNRIFAPPGSSAAARGIAAFGDGAIAVAGQHLVGDKGTRNGYVFVVDKINKLAWADTYASKYHSTLADVVVDVHGSLIATGLTRTGLGFNSSGLLLYYNSAGKRVHQELVSANAQWSGILAAARHPTGGLVVVGDAKQAKSTFSWIGRVDGTRKLKWLRKFPVGSVARDLVVTAGGHIRAAGKVSYAGGKSSAALFAMDPLGNRVKTLMMPLAAESEYFAIAEAADGSLVTGGHSIVKGQRIGVITRMDTWGNYTCKGSGGCLGTSPVKCDDKNPCTIDVCSPKKGCQHLSAEGTACPAPSACTVEGRCTVGKCVEGPQSRIYMRTALTGVSSVVRTQVAKDDTHLVLGRRVDGRLFGLDTTKVGDATYNSAIGSVLHDAIHDAVYTVHNSIAVFGKMKGSKSTTLYLVTLLHKVLWSKTVCDSSKATCLGGVLLTGGGVPRLISLSYAKSLNKLSMIRFSATNTKSPIIEHKALPMSSPGRYMELHDADGFADSGAVVCGSMHPVSGAPKGTNRHGFIMRVSSAGSLQWAKTVPGPYKRWLSNCQVAYKGGGIIAAAQEVVAPAAPTSFVVMRIDATGKVVATQSIADGAIYSLTGLATRADGSAVIGALRGAGGTVKRYLHAFNLDLDTIWTRSAPALSGTIGTANHALTKNHREGVLMAYRRKAGDKYYVDTMRTDRWGWWTCKDAGKCAAAEVKHCNDGKECTLDICDAFAGCKYKPLSKTCKE